MQLLHEPSPEKIKEDQLYTEMGLSHEEYNMVENIIGRLPNYTETGLFSAMWSEHCSYKNSKVLLKKFPTSGEAVLQGPGEGAGIIDIGDGQAAVFKVESHNSPSAVEPYQGAATGAGGIIRDVFSMGARPVALLNSLRFGELENPRVKYLFEEAVAGIAGYGNAIGIPTVGGEVQFDPCYEGNPLVNAMCVGLIDHKDIQKGQAKGVGNAVLYVGSSTGRDGIHGATFSSRELSEENKSPDIQAGDPFVQKLLMEACLEAVKSDALIGIQDMGAAGLTSSAAEMASKAGSGIELDLDLVPQRNEGLTPYEMMLSESQERMLLVIEAGREEEMIQLFDRYDVNSKVIGRVTDDKQLRLIFGGEVVAEVPVDALDEDAPVYHKPNREPEYYRQFQQADPYRPMATDIGKTLKDLLAQPTIASKEWVYNQYDHMIGTSTVVAPGSDAAVLRVRGTNKAIAMTTDCNSRYLYLDPYVGGKITIAEATRNIVCSGAKPLALSDCLNYGNPENPEIFWQLERSTDGLSEACRVLDTPVIGGNVSLFNERSGKAVYPTPVIGVVGLIENVDHITKQQFQQAGDLIYLIGEAEDDFGGSELQKIEAGDIFGKAPNIDLQVEKERQDQVLKAIQAGTVSSAHDLSEGGFLVALAECTFSTDFGAKVKLTNEDLIKECFSETPSRYIISVPKDMAKLFEEIVPHASCIGQVTERQDLTLEDDQEKIIFQEEVSILEETWKGAIACLVK